jgi:hypothetical protein
LDFYANNKAAGEAARILQYLDIWKGLHTATVNISDKGWEELKTLSSSLGILAKEKSELQSFLFVLETYLATLMKLILLQRRGTRITTIRNLQTSFNTVRGIIEEDLFEWFVDASTDRTIPQADRSNLAGAFELLSNTLWEVDLARIDFDLFREIYQNILSPEIRRSLGEFYTNEDIVNETLDSAGVNDTTIMSIYQQYESDRTEQLFLDPACGSGTFLTTLIERISAVLSAKGVQNSKICDFLSKCVVGIDINPFAVYMAKLNILLKLTQLMHDCHPNSLRVIWADSLTKYEKSVTMTGFRSLTLKIPFLAGFISTGTMKIELPEPEEFLPLEDLVDTVDQFVVAQSGKQSLRGHLEGIGGMVARNLGGYIHLVEDLYDTIESVHAGGNSRLVKLLKNIIKTHDIRGRCRYVIGNPPWVRIHGIHSIVLKYLKETYSVFDSAKTYKPGFKKTSVPFGSQFDYSMAFVESGLDYLEDGGVIGYVITSKIMQTTYAGELRRILLNLEILHIIDYSLYRVSLFQDAVNYPLIIAVRKTTPSKVQNVSVTIHSTSGSSKSFIQAESSISLYTPDQRSPWVLAPPEVMMSFRKMQKSGERLGDIEEIQRGVVTGTNKVFLVKKILSTTKNICQVELFDGTVTSVEHNCICPLVRGRDIDPFKFRTVDYLIFTHDTNGNVLCDLNQHQILSAIAVEMKKLRRKPAHEINMSSSGSTLVYSMPINAAQLIANLRTTFASLGVKLATVKPCAVEACWKATKGGSTVLVSVEGSARAARVFIGNLEIPHLSSTTNHFMQNLSSLVKRDDHKPGDLPWTIYRVSKKKLSEKVGWQENATEIEASILPPSLEATIGSRNYRRPLVPLQTAYFVVPEDPAKRNELLYYLNSVLARSFMKLICWKGQGGYFRHISSSMGHLPMPKTFAKSIILSEGKRAPEKDNPSDQLPSEPTKDRWEEILDGLSDAFNLSPDEITQFAAYATWLNEVVDNSAIEEDEDSEE